MTAPALPSTPGLTTAGLVQDGETVIIACKPSLWFILLRKAGSLLMAGAIATAAYVLDSRGVLDLGRPDAVAAAGVVCTCGLLAWLTLDRATRLYLLTDRRIVRVSGVLRQSVAEARLTDVVNLTLYRSLRERLFGLGTVVVSTAGAGGAAGEFSWFMVDAPHEKAAMIREAIDRATGSGPGTGPTRGPSPPLRLHCVTGPVARVVSTARRAAGRGPA